MGTGHTGRGAGQSEPAGARPSSCLLPSCFPTKEHLLHARRRRDAQRLGSRGWRGGGQQPVAVTVTRLSPGAQLAGRPGWSGSGGRGGRPPHGPQAPLPTRWAALNGSRGLRGPARRSAPNPPRGLFAANESPLKGLALGRLISLHQEIIFHSAGQGWWQALTPATRSRQGQKAGSPAGDGFVPGREGRPPLSPLLTPGEKLAGAEGPCGRAGLLGAGSGPRSVRGCGEDPWWAAPRLTALPGALPPQLCSRGADSTWRSPGSHQPARTSEKPQHLPSNLTRDLPPSSFMLG